MDVKLLYKYNNKLDLCVRIGVRDLVNVSRVAVGAALYSVTGDSLVLI